LAAAFSSPCDASSAVRAAPSMRRTGTRSPTPSSAHQTLAITLCRRGRAVELQEEMLLLLDALVDARTDVLHKGPAGIECVGGRGTQGLALGRLEVGARLQRAAHAGRQVLGELEGPLPVTDPAAVASGGLGVAAS
jgi:hypothetical protein